MGNREGERTRQQVTDQASFTGQAPGVKLSGAKIKAAALALLANAPAGIRWTALVQMIATAHSATPKNTIRARLQSLFADPRKVGVVKPARGLYLAAKFAETEAASKAEDNSATADDVVKATGASAGKSVKERDFYQPFVDWLRDDAEQVTEAAVIGGAGLKDKWGTPDIIGVLKPRWDDIVKFPIEVVSAEIKIEAGKSIIAFGQAVAYRLFSHKVFVVLPTTAPPADIDRMEALAVVCGVGLVTFAPDPDAPAFEMRVRPQSNQPDMFYVNQMAASLKLIDENKADKSKAIAEMLFG